MSQTETPHCLVGTIPPPPYLGARGSLHGTNNFFFCGGIRSGVLFLLRALSRRDRKRCRSLQGRHSTEVCGGDGRRRQARGGGGEAFSRTKGEEEERDRLSLICVCERCVRTIYLVDIDNTALKSIYIFHRLVKESENIPNLWRTNRIRDNTFTSFTKRDRQVRKFEVGLIDYS